MQRGNLDDLVAFVAIGRERSFTKAAAKLGLSQSALSHTIRELEARLGVVVRLRSLGLGKYEAIFRENDIDETVLRSLTHENLKELGVASFGHAEQRWHPGASRG